LLKFRIDNKVLSAIKDVSLSLFLAIVGLQYGYETISALGGGGVILAGISFIVKIVALLAGYLVGRYVFKMNCIILEGSMCGGATSTPGLAVAIDATKTNQVANGYGGACHFGLIFKVIFVIMLHTFTY
jgi:putative transport protein